MWFDKKYLKSYQELDPVFVPYLKGFVLPHASLAYTYNIMLHTFRFRPSSISFDKVVIFYYPASNTENVTTNEGKYYHEYFTVWKTCEYLFEKWWGIKHTLTFVPINVRDNKKIKINMKNTFVIISSDFSHFLPFQEAIEKENKASHALEFKNFSHPIVKEVVDDWRTYQYVFDRLPSTYQLKWIGRTRSPGEKGVGYLSFLIIDNKEINIYSPIPNGVFVTCYDEELNPRECLGQWENITKDEILKLTTKVINKGQRESRLTGGVGKNIPINHCMITLLYKEEKEKNNRKEKENMIRGWHGVLSNAFYLPEVFLEHTYENGVWIQSNHNDWNSKNPKKFNMNETLQQLARKASSSSTASYALYKSHTIPIYV